MAEVTDSHLRLAGMALAHAVWSIDDGSTLCTLAMLQDHDERFLTRYEADTIPESIQYALEDLKDRLQGECFAALVYDGFYTPEDGERTDALIVELLAANAPGESKNTAAQVGRIVQQYARTRRAGFLGIGRGSRLKLLGRPLIVGPLPQTASGLILQGAFEHEKARDYFRDL